jgi:hypothetical protein
MTMMRAGWKLGALCCRQSPAVDSRYVKVASASTYVEVQRNAAMQCSNALQSDPMDAFQCGDVASMVTSDVGLATARCSRWPRWSHFLQRASTGAGMVRCGSGPLEASLSQIVTGKSSQVEKLSAPHEIRFDRHWTNERQRCS